MAKWVYNRPLDCCDETELRVAKLLARLPDEWIRGWRISLLSLSVSFLMASGHLAKH